MSSLESRDSVDARALLQRVATDVRDATLEILWQQWRIVGAMTTVSRARVDSSVSAQPIALIDPEALVLASLLRASDEPRVLDIVRDWTTRNSTLLSVQRMNNLVERYPEALQGQLTRRVAWLATIASEAGKDPRWRPLAKHWADSAHLEPLFVATQASRASGESVPHATRTKSRATPARLISPATLLFRLRLGLGVGIKADAIAYLLARTDMWSTVRDVSEALCYTPVATRRAIDDLAAARLIDVREESPARYRAHTDDWKALLLLQNTGVRWGGWQERFAFVAAILHWADEARDRPLSPYAFGVHGRALLERHRSAFALDDVAVWGEHTAVSDWSAFVAAAVRDLLSAMRETL
jgi:hypothetical protein